MKRDLSQMIKYAFWGAVTTSINLLLFFLLDKVGIHYILASATAYFMAVIINFLLNYYFVFERKKELPDGILKKFFAFLRLRIASFAVDSGLLFFMVSIWCLPKYPCRIGLSIGIILFNFVWSKRKIFVGNECI